MSALRYAIVTPARNERENLARLASSIVAQRQRPARWVIVDDGSDDGMHRVAAELARRHDWIRLVGTGEDASDLAEGRRRGRDLLAFRRGIGSLDTAVDIFVKVDADTSFDEDYFERLLERFATDPLLGIAGGCCYEQGLNGEWERVLVSDTHPRGASRAYRWALREILFELEPELGWDGVDEVMAELRGYRTAGFQDFGFRHHRRVGEREGRLRAGSALGRQAWYMGYRPTYLLLRAVYRARRNAASLAMVWGYTAAAVTNAPQCPHAPVTARVREGQRLRTVIRRGRWT